MITVDIISGEVEYKKDGMLSEGTIVSPPVRLTFTPVKSVPDKPETLRGWMEQQKEEDERAPCFGSASKMEEKVGEFRISTTDTPVAVRRYHDSGFYEDVIVVPGEDLELETIEGNAVTAALYGVLPQE